MNQNLLKMLLRSIKSTIGRYLAILAIVALGVGFFAGLKSSEPSMRGTAANYLQQQNMYDFQLMSSLGISEENVEALGELDFVRLAEGAYNLDALVQRGDKQEAFKFLSLPEEVCLPVLLEGRMPEGPGECLADSMAFDASAIGTKIQISPGNEEDTLDMLCHEAYTIVGIAKTPRYISANRESTHLGSGQIKSFVYLQPEGFDSEYYHELLLCCHIPYAPFTDEYNEMRDALSEEIKTAFNREGAQHYKKLRAEADEELADARQKLDEGWQEYADGKKEAEEELEEAAKELNDAQYQLDQGREQLRAAQKQLDTAHAQLPGALANLDKQLETAKAAQSQLETEYAAFLADKASQLAPYEAEAAAKQQAYDSLAEDHPDKAAALAALEQAQAALAAVQAPLDGADAQLQQGLAELAANVAMLDATRTAMKEQFDALPAQQRQIEAGLQELDAGQREINENWGKYHEGAAEAEQELADALQELEDGEQEYLDAIEEINEALQLDLYTLSHAENPGCATFQSDVSIVDAVANVFPVFFALIAALVCSTTMTRMVTEERTQIGTLKAMGYSAGSIMAKYLLYAGSSAFLGCCLGFWLGITVIPYVVWVAYSMIYDYAKLEFYYSIPLCLACLLVAVLGTLLVTWYACGRELAAKPAELIRPKVEGKGKRVFLERIGPLWRRLSFLNKVTIRNALRYKSRVCMMLLGIGGCTALLIAGFGVRDSVVNVMGDQYEKIFLYDLSVRYEPEELSGPVESYWGKDSDRFALVYKAEADIQSENGAETAQLVAADGASLQGIIAFFDDQGELAYPRAGEAMLSKRLAEQLGVKQGDSITVQNEDGVELQLQIVAICRNYVGNYLYVSREAVREADNTAWLCAAEGVSAETLGAALRSEDGVSYVSILDQEQKQMAESMSSLDIVVALVIVCSAALAFITLYNLTNINILERLREIATVKVLGFRPQETASYILRENVMLSFVGAAVGLYLGKLLHGVIIRMLQVDGVSFGEDIALVSYVLGFAVTILFACLCNLAMHGKLKKVNMAESLKSVE